MRVTFDFKLGEVVVILALGVEAKIRACLIGAAGMEYQVSYWYDGDRNIMWLTRDELKGIENEDGKSGRRVGLARPDPKDT